MDNSSARYMHVYTYGSIEQSDGSYIDEDGEHLWFDAAGEYHREDGPAIIYDDGSGDIYWYINGTKYDLFDEWLKLSPIADEQKMMLRLRYA
tara:strand:+ start:262 stop:537 length:276 start_codon:yes stop_codon:yes gene_type:complete